MTWRRVLRVAGWNAVLLACGLISVAVAAEAWLRLTRPWMRTERPQSYVPGVVRLFAPHGESRWTDDKEFWQVSRANSLGFLDREPPSPELARAGCHVAWVGDSFVEAKEVAVADKSQVRLEEMAAARLPHLDVVTSAWGVQAMGQVQQLPWWDKWIRLWSPDVVALVFVYNDFSDNAGGEWPAGGQMELNIEVAGPRFATAHRAAGGRIVLRLPGTTLVPHEPESHWARALWPSGLWLPSWYWRQRFEVAIKKGGGGGRMPPSLLLSPDLDFTAFALDQWRERTQRAGSRLVVLSTHVNRLPSWLSVPEESFERLEPLLEAQGIPLLDQYDYIVRQGGDPRHASWGHDLHWSPQGHQWAAEAILEYLERDPGTCSA